MIYRLVHFPVSPEETLVPLWLWSDEIGVFSHETALALHDLSGLLPSRTHMTLPTSWKRRRLRVPSGLVLHYADLKEKERTQAAVVPVTTPGRTLQDCIDEGTEPGHIQEAIRGAQRRGLITSALAERLGKTAPKEDGGP